MSEVLSVIAANFLLIALVCVLFGALGWLWFQPGSPIGLSPEDGTLSRLAVYPLLGWMLALVGVNWLRILAIPFRSSAPWLLAGLVLLPCAFQGWRLFKKRPNAGGFPAFLKERGRPICVLGGIVFVFAMIPANRLAVPAFYEPGVWGYDQTNYVHIADQYLDRGMFEPGDVPSENVLAPWVSLNASLFKGLFSETQVPFSTIPTMQSFTRQLGLIMRNGGAAMDASLAAWFHLDGLQAYALSGYVQYLMLVLAGIWVGLQMRLPILGSIFLGAIAGLWPIAIFPSVLDNRDQTLAMVLVVVLLGAVFSGALNFWIRGLILGALALTYIEILPVAMLVWGLLHFDEKRPWFSSLRMMFAEGLVALGCSFIFVPWGAQFLAAQMRNSPTMAMSLPLGEQFGPASNFAGTFAGIVVGSSQSFLAMAAVAGGAFLVLQMGGLGLWIQQKRYFAFAAFALLAAAAVVFQQKGLPYASYKLFTVLFPLAVLLCASCVSFFVESRLGASAGRWRGIVRISVLGLLILCVPAVALGAVMRSGFSFEGLKGVEGINSLLENRSKLTLGRGLAVRSNDVIKARDVVLQTDPGEGVALANFSRFDQAYFAHFLRQRSVKIFNGFTFDENVPTRNMLFSPNHAFLKAGDRVGKVIVLCGPTDDLEHPDPSKDIAIVRGKIDDLQTGRTFASFSVPSDQPVAFVQRIYSQMRPLDAATPSDRSHFFFGGKGIALGIYAVNADTRPRTLTFDVIPGPSVKAAIFQKRAQTWQCLIDGQNAEGWRMTPAERGVKFEIPLLPLAAGNIIEVGPKDRLPIDQKVIYRNRPEWIQKPGAVNEIVNIVLEDSK